MLHTRVASNLWRSPAAWLWLAAFFAAPAAAVAQPGQPTAPGQGPIASDMRGGGRHASANGRIDATANPDAASSPSSPNYKAQSSRTRRRMRHLAQRFQQPGGPGDNAKAGDAADSSSAALGPSTAGRSPAAQTSAEAQKPEATKGNDPDFHNGADEKRVSDGDRPASHWQATATDPPGQSDKPIPPPAGPSGRNQSNASLPEGGDNWFLQTLAALGVVIGLILLARWAWMKLSGQVSTTAGGSRAVEVLSRTAVAPKNHVLLLRVGQRVLIVGDSSQGLQTLAQVDDPDEVADLLTSVTSQKEESITNSFRQTMARVSGHFDKHSRADDADGRDEAEHHIDRSRNELSSLLSRVRTLASQGGRP